MNASISNANPPMKAIGEVQTTSVPLISGGFRKKVGAAQKRTAS